MDGKNLTAVTTEEKNMWPSHGVVKLEKPFVDGRGSIKPLVDTIMRSAMVIESKAGSLRANHYHKTDWHYCYVVSGQIEYLQGRFAKVKDFTSSSFSNCSHN